LVLGIGGNSKVISSYSAPTHPEPPDVPPENDGRSKLA
jgi:hypothetical protein